LTSELIGVGPVNNGSSFVPSFRGRAIWEKINSFSINIDHSRAIAQKLGIQGIPTLIIKKWQIGKQTGRGTTSAVI